MVFDASASLATNGFLHSAATIVGRKSWLLPLARHQSAAKLCAFLFLRQSSQRWWKRRRSRYSFSLTLNHVIVLGLYTGAINW